MQTQGRDLSQELQDLAEETGIDLIGFAPVSRLEQAPRGARPTDYMPAARTVVVLAKKMLDAIVEVAGHYEEPGKTLGPYMWYGYPVLNWDLSSAATRVARQLEKKGYRALPFPPTGINYKYGTRADFSHRHAAAAAGLGELGFSGLFLTPQFGPRQRLVSIVTDAPLEPTPMYGGTALCRPEACGRACLKACPTRAMTGKVTLTIADTTYTHARLHPVRCKWPFPEKGFRRTQVPMPPDPSEDDLRAAVASTRVDPFDAALTQFTFVPQCGACIFSCPSPRFDPAPAVVS